MLLLGACTDASLPPGSGGGVCQSITTPITTIQGDGYHSPLVDSFRSVRGTVTYVTAESGFYLEDTESPPDQASSRALFISDSDLARSVVPGQRLELSGRVSELGTRLDKLTALVEISGHEICAGEVELPSTRAQLPMNSAAREALEGMRVSFGQTLTLTDVYNLARGELTLSSNGVLRVPTEVSTPGNAARKLEQENRDHSLVAVLPASGAAMAAGATTQYISGLMGHNGRGQQLFLNTAPEMDFEPPALPAPALENTVRAVSSNLLNFFNGDGKGGGFPTERGAGTMDEFLAQSARTRAVMEQLQPDLLAVQELENDGFGPYSAAQSLLDLLQDTGHDDWAFIAPAPGGIGGDVITVGLFYRRQVLQAVGSPRVLDSPEFRGLSRQPLAQLFRDVRTGTTLLVAVNHLKSKGSCPEGGENSDRQDGQNCWNQARLAAVNVQIPWLEGLAEDMGTKNILILGDMNSWRNEDPIRQFTDSGFVDLVAQRSGLPLHSFLYWGQTGTLDYVFASPALTKSAQSAVIWHINADWPAGMDQPRPWLRASDHDPVIVDLDFSHFATSN
ncbi:MAG: ExeM/NucH family extracellular endonuclease [Xanthomonadales bacterium]|nr:ExeM/NucH family extracellular endonuclease [Xanthomonadales bacterium]